MSKNCVSALILCCSYLVLSFTPSIRAQEAADKKLEKLAVDSRARAEGIEVTVPVGEDTIKGKLHTEPLMKYTDVPRQIEMATLWVWQEDGRPIAVGKVEAYERKGETKWLYCFASVSTGLVDGKWPTGQSFQAKKPGIEWKTLKGNTPHETAVGRQRQMKELFQQFAATTRDDLLKTSDELRPLARRLHEYTSPKHGVIQGWLCGFAANGTNPDVVLLLEAVEANGDEHPTKSWRYSVIGMTALGISVKFDKQEVFNRPYSKSPADFGNWTYFWESQAKK